jgi:hypothetical protein
MRSAPPPMNCHPSIIAIETRPASQQPHSSPHRYGSRGEGDLKSQGAAPRVRRQDRACRSNEVAPHYRPARHSHHAGRDVSTRRRRPDIPGTEVSGRMESPLRWHASGSSNAHADAACWQIVPESTNGPCPVPGDATRLSFSWVEADRIVGLGTGHWDTRRPPGRIPKLSDFRLQPAGRRVRVRSR